jgi:hypothetical protein
MLKKTKGWKDGGLQKLRRKYTFLDKNEQAG